MKLESERARERERERERERKRKSPLISLPEMKRDASFFQTANRNRNEYTHARNNISSEYKTYAVVTKKTNQQILKLDQIKTTLVEIFLRNYLRFSHFSIFWEILGDFSDFFRKFSIASENYRMKNLIFEEKRRNIRFLKYSKKSLPFSPDISYFLRIR